MGFEFMEGRWWRAEGVGWRNGEEVHRRRKMCSEENMFELIICHCNSISEYTVLETHMEEKSDLTCDWIIANNLQAIAKMVDEAMLYINKAQSKEEKLRLIDTIRTVTEGKV